jgi:hypothetical protein
MAAVPSEDSDLGGKCPSVCELEDASLVFQSKNAEIYRIGDFEAAAVHQRLASHAEGTCVVTHPAEVTFVTVGSERFDVRQICGSISPFNATAAFFFWDIEVDRAHGITVPSPSLEVGPVGVGRFESTIEWQGHRVSFVLGPDPRIELDGVRVATGVLPKSPETANVWFCANGLSISTGSASVVIAKSPRSTAIKAARA